ncbi:jg22926 [Pararge aegeria aegeria]|uniref:Jg22926 protein n=1 Tax=Pararge aegeria aegeria TaxID=348720 RepID=A0A8S4RJA0_9NEOP|nr:jg22926 [Pararge aegeria aegeria]
MLINPHWTRVVVSARLTIGLKPTVGRVAADAAPRWIAPASRAYSRSLAGRPGCRVLHGVLLRSQGVLLPSCLFLWLCSGLNGVVTGYR